MTVPNHPDLQIEIMTTEERFFELGHLWNSFLEECGVKSVFLTWEYLKNWWEVYGGEYQLYVVLMKDESGQLLGIAPLMIGRGHTFPRRAFRHLTFIGGLGDSLSEYQDLIVRPGYEQRFIQAVVHTVFTEIETEWDLLFLPLMDETSATLIHFVAELPKRNCHMVQLTSRSAPHIPLPGSWDEFIKAKSKNFKKQFNNQWNRLHKKHDVEWLEAGKDIEVGAAMKIVSSLNRERWGSEGDTFKSAEFSQFHERLANDFLAKNWLYLRLLKVDGTYAAARYDFVYADKLWNYQNGWLPELANLSLGKLMIGDCVRWCINQGLDEYDFLAGETDYKRSWATKTRQLVTMEVSNPLSRKAIAYEQMRRFKNRMDRVRKARADRRLAKLASVA